MPVGAARRFTTTRHVTSPWRETRREIRRVSLWGRRRQTEKNKQERTRAAARFFHPATAFRPPTRAQTACKGPPWRCSSETLLTTSTRRRPGRQPHYPGVAHPVRQRGGTRTPASTTGRDHGVMFPHGARSPDVGASASADARSGRAPPARRPCCTGATAGGSAGSRCGHAMGGGLILSFGRFHDPSRSVHDTSTDLGHCCSSAFAVLLVNHTGPTLTACERGCLP